MKQFKVTGMSCAACSARVEKAVSELDGVSKCDVNLLTSSMSVSGTASVNDIISAVEKAGYGAAEKDKETKLISVKDDSEEKKLKSRLISSGILLVLLMYVSMGHIMWGWYLPEFISRNPLVLAFLELSLTIVILIINRKFFINGLRAVTKKAPNMDSLVALGSGASFVYSLYILFTILENTLNGNVNEANHLLHGLYFESAAMIVTLITLGKMLEARSKGKTTDAIESLMKMAPKTATVIKDGKEVLTDISDLEVGDIFAVKPGESIPADGIVTEGVTAVDESPLTGESIPVDKKEGDKVSASTINQSGYILCRAEKVGEDTTLGEIIKLVTEASSGKAPISKVADKVSGVFVPLVIGLAFLSMIVWLILGKSFEFSLTRGIAVLVISCPCALGLATPVAVMAGSGKGAKNGILFKSAVALEVAGKCNILALDKTGTVTKGEMKVTDVFVSPSVSEKELLEVAYSLEAKSEHPLSKAIVNYGKEKGITLFNTEEFLVHPGNGISGTVNGIKVSGGKEDFIKSTADIDGDITAKANDLKNQGKTVMFFEKDKKVLGLIAVSDVLKDDSVSAVSKLKAMGLRVVMLTGDNNITAKAVAEKAGIDEVWADLLPQNKAKVISELSNDGRVMMVGDGINDAPALTKADIGVAIGRGTDIAIDSADVVVMKSRLTDVQKLISLSRATLKIIHENLFWAFCYNVLGIPIAAGVFSATGLTLSPMLGALFMSLSSFCVVSNALRLNIANLDKIKHGKYKKKKEKKSMEKILKIEGMMCQHCSGRVKKVLEELSEVEEAFVSHEEGTAVIKLKENISDEVLKKTVEEQGYKVIG